MFLILLIISALAIRLHLIFNTHPAADEIWSLFLLENSDNDIWLGAIADNNSPFYFLFIRSLSDFLHIPLSIYFLRLMSLVFGIPTSVGMYYVARFLFDKKTGIIAFILSLFLPAFIWISVLGRYYGFLALVSVLSIFFFVRLLEKRSNKYFVIVLAFLLFGLYTHFYYVFFILALTVYLVFSKNIGYFFKKWLVGLAIIGILFGPVAFQFLSGDRWEVVNVDNSIFKIPAVIISNISSFLIVIFIQHYQAYWYFLVVVPLFLITLVLLYLGFKTNNDLYRRVLLLLMVFPIILATILSYLVKPLFAVNSFLIFLPAQTLLLASGILYSLKKQKIVALSFIILAIVTYIPFLQAFELTSSFAEPFLYIKQNIQNKDVVLHTDIYTFIGGRYYLNQNINIPLIKSVTSRTSERTHGYFPKQFEDIEKDNYGRLWFIEPYFYNIDIAKRAKAKLDRELILVKEEKFRDSGINVYLYKKR